MTDFQWKCFCDFKEDLKKQVEIWTKAVPNLTELQKSAALKRNTPEYPFETPVVYNRALDELTVDDEIKLIVIGDNPGKDEQLKINNKYLVGQAGKIAEGYFKKNPELGVDFRKNVIILNKTPVHSAKTNQLKDMVKEGGKSFADLLSQSQIWMAKKTAQLQQQLGCELWLVGYSELKEKGIFKEYRDVLKSSYSGENLSDWNKVFVFQHFSMNRFTIDLADYIKSNGNEKISLSQNIHDLGSIHKSEIFGN